MLGVKSEILKRYIAVMSVLRGYPRVAAIVLLVQYQRRGGLASTYDTV